MRSGSGLQVPGSGLQAPIGSSSLLRQPTPAGPQQMSAVSFQLRGADLAAKDKKLLGKNSSDPYYVLRAAGASGQPVELGRSKEIMKELNPSWEAVEVRRGDLTLTLTLTVTLTLALTLTPTLTRSPCRTPTQP